jgi:hypothetical protein
MKNKNIPFTITLVFLLISILAFCTSCNPNRNKPPKISGIEASTVYVYPKGKATLNCTVTDPEGDNILFKWSCSDGTFIGSGPVITWKAPNQYGEFHIMVIAEDTSGNSDQAMLTIGVVANENQKKSCCGN